MDDTSAGGTVGSWLHAHALVVYVIIRTNPPADRGSGRGGTAG